MGLRSLSAENDKNNRYLLSFKQGDEKALAYFYRKSYSSLLYVGKELINDEFLVSCILHECYLKVWAHRENIESLAHAYRFVRMNLRWQVLRQIQKTPYQVYRQMVFIDHFETTVGDFEDQADLSVPEHTHEKLEEASKAMSYLPDERQMIATLYFKQGLTRQQIAQRLGSTSAHISGEIEKSVEQIKKMVLLKRNPKPRVQQQSEPDVYAHILTRQQASVYALRQAHKMSFAEIANRLGYGQSQVQQHYIQAYQLVKNHWKQNRQ